jgi:hypothetical protein
MGTDASFYSFGHLFMHWPCAILKYFGNLVVLETEINGRIRPLEASPLFSNPPGFHPMQMVFKCHGRSTAATQIQEKLIYTMCLHK